MRPSVFYFLPFFPPLRVCVCRVLLDSSLTTIHVASASAAAHSTATPASSLFATGATAHAHTRSHGWTAASTSILSAVHASAHRPVVHRTSAH